MLDRSSIPGRAGAFRRSSAPGPDAARVADLLGSGASGQPLPGPALAGRPHRLPALLRGFARIARASQSTVPWYCAAGLAPDLADAAGPYAARLIDWKGLA